MSNYGDIINRVWAQRTGEKITSGRSERESVRLTQEQFSELKAVIGVDDAVYQAKAGGMVDVAPFPPSRRGFVVVIVDRLEDSSPYEWALKRITDRTLAEFDSLNNEQGSDRPGDKIFSGSANDFQNPKDLVSEVERPSESASDSPLPDGVVEYGGKRFVWDDES